MKMNLRIRDLREDADLTQQQVAQILLCDQYERELPLGLAVKLADLYHVSLDYLVGRTNQKEST